MNISPIDYLLIIYITKAYFFMTFLKNNKNKQFKTSSRRIQFQKNNNHFPNQMQHKFILARSFTLIFSSTKQIISTRQIYYLTSFQWLDKKWTVLFPSFNQFNQSQSYRKYPLIVFLEAEIKFHRASFHGTLSFHRF